MSTALTIKRQSLASLSVPGAMFSPTELVIGSSTSPDEYRRIGKALVAIKDADELWQCDYAYEGMKRYGADAGLQLAHEATGLSLVHLKRCARIAEVFTSERRHPN